MTDQSSASVQPMREAKKSNTPVKDKRKAMVEKQLMDAACLLFAEKGYSGTTLSDIAESISLTRAAVYYYFKNKEALLEAIMMDLTQTPIGEIAAWRKIAPESSVERLHSFVKMRIRSILKRQVQMRMVEVTEAALPPDLLKRHTKAKRHILSEYRSILAEGMKRGEFRAQDDRIAALGIIGIVNWTTKWYVTDRGPSVETISGQLADMAVASVVLPSARQDSFKSTESALDTLREDLNQLELLIKPLTRHQTDNDVENEA